MCIAPLAGRCHSWVYGLEGFVRGVLTVIVWLVLATPGFAQEYEAGRRAFQAGEAMRAVEIWRPLARAGSARAQFGLGVAYERGGAGLAQDPQRAAEWYGRAARQGHRDAQTNLGRMYAEGRGVPRDPSRAAMWWRKAARAGQAVAQYNLALSLYQGRGAVLDRGRAVTWMRRSAGRGLAAAQFALGEMYRRGLAVDRDPSRALAWLARAARQGHQAAGRAAAALRQEGITPAVLPDEERGSGRVAGRAPSQTSNLPGGRVLSRTQPGAANEEGGAMAVGRRGDVAKYRTLWLGSAESRGAARRQWDGLRERFGDVLESLRPRFRTVSGPDEPPLVRVLAGVFRSEDRAMAVCRKLRAMHRGTFCQVVGSNR
jgi:TPR repeat protein